MLIFTVASGNVERYVGSVAMLADADFVLKNTKNCYGFYGASSMESLPTEVALTEQTKKFKQIGR